MPIRLLFTTRCICDLVSLCRDFWWQKAGDSPGPPVVPRCMADLTCFFTPESVTYWGAHLFKGLPVSGGGEIDFVADIQGKTSQPLQYCLKALLPQLSEDSEGSSFWIFAALEG